MTTLADDLHERVLVLMPSTRDAERTATVLRAAHVPSTVCADLASLCRELRLGAGAVLLTDDYILGDSQGQLAETMRTQPGWSHVPIVAIAREAASQHLQKVASPALDGFIVVERPVRMHSLLSVLHSALRTRKHQYQIRDDMQLREQQATALQAQEERLRFALAELAAQTAQLRDNDRRKDEFLATLAHELRNPLAPIRTGIDVLRGTPSAATAERTLGVMDRQITHMVRLIDDLLDVSRITRGVLELRKEAVTLGTVLGAAVEASRTQVARASHDLKVAIPEPELVLDIDATRIAQAVSNLLINASKYTPPGGHLVLSATREGGKVHIEVQDDGIGIPAERLTDVFEMFSQIDPALEGAQNGLGIGLALVRSVVEMHGGSVRATSPGRGLGSTFHLELPLSDVTSERAAPKSPRVDIAPSRRILVVDDNDDAAEMLSLMLECGGYDTRTAHDGESALAVTEEYSPDIVILDIGLPGASGYDVARELRKRPRAQGLGLIALTGWGTDEDKKKAHDAGFDIHLTKPVDGDRLHAALTEVERRVRSDHGRA